MTVQDFEKDPRKPPTVWVVNIPNENASVEMSAKEPHEGKGCLKLHYRSLSTGAGQGGVMDYTGWKEVTFDLDAPHETWGGDRNGKMDSPIAAVVFTVGQPVERVGGAEKLLAAEGDLCFDSLCVDSERSAEETLGGEISVVSPAYCSEVKGDTTVRLAAPGFRSATVKCWVGGDFFMVNLATGGGWPVDLSRYAGLADMYLDYVRVDQAKE